MKVPEDFTTLKAYVPGKSEEQAKREYGLSRVVKLASNENPLGPSPKAVAAITAAAAEVHRYPDPSAGELRQALADYFSVDPWWLGVGNGSDEIIDILIRTFCAPGESVLTSQGAFPLYKIRAQICHAQCLQAPMTAKMCFDTEAMTELWQKNADKVRLVFIANPNNPTGTYINGAKLRAFCQQAEAYTNTLVVIDEAYNEFVRAEDYASGLDLVRDFANVVVLRTMSKVYGLAGVRVGAMVARPEIISWYEKVRTSFNVNRLGQVAVSAALSDKEFLAQAQQVTWQGLDFFYSELQRLGLRYYPSQGNFVFFDSGSENPKFNEELLRRGVILRPIPGFGTTQHFRMSVGTAAENEVAIKALEQVLKI